MMICLIQLGIISSAYFAILYHVDVIHRYNLNNFNHNKSHSHTIKLAENDARSLFKSLSNIDIKDANCTGTEIKAVT